MADYPIIVDVAKFQRSDLAFFQELKDNGAKGVIVQLTAGTDGYPWSHNPRAAEQINNAHAVGLPVHAYHYCYSSGPEGVALEAQNFINQFYLLGLDPENSFAFLDEEDNTYNSYYATNDINTWLNAVHEAGIKKCGTYSMSSWFNAGRIVQDNLVDPFIWVASYGTSQPNVDRTNMWQFTDHWNGVDASYDFNSALIGDPNVDYQDKPEVSLPTTEEQPYVEWKPAVYTIKSGDTLTNISQLTQDSIATIIANNPDQFPNGVDSIIYPGNELLVNDRGIDFGKHALTEYKYIVQDGDTLWGMSNDPEKVGDRPDTIMANNPDVFNWDMNATIYPGQVILYYR